MPYWIFTEDEKGRYGCLGWRDSEVAANDAADNQMGITYVKHYDTYDRGEAKRYFRGGKAKTDLNEGRKIIRNKSTVGSME